MTLDQWLRHSQLPRLEARMLLQHAGGYSRVQLVTQGADPLPEAVAAQLDILQARRLKTNIASMSLFPIRLISKPATSI